MKKILFAIIVSGIVFFNLRSPVEAANYSCNLSGQCQYSFFGICIIPQIVCSNCESDGSESICFVQDADGNIGKYCYNSSTRNVNNCGQGCGGGDLWSKYKRSCRLVKRTEQTTNTGGLIVTKTCRFAYAYEDQVCSTADKCISPSGDKGLRPGYCNCSYGSNIYKKCCRYAKPVNCIQVDNDGHSPPEGVCPSGTGYYQNRDLSGGNAQCTNHTPNPNHVSPGNTHIYKSTEDDSVSLIGEAVESSDLTDKVRIRIVADRKNTDMDGTGWSGGEYGTNYDADMRLSDTDTDIWSVFVDSGANLRGVIRSDSFTSPGYTYRWRVAAEDNNNRSNSYSGFTGMRYFRINARPSPRQLSPANGAVFPSSTTYVDLVADGTDPDNENTRVAIRWYENGVDKGWVSTWVGETDGTWSPYTLQGGNHAGRVTVVQGRSYTWKVKTQDSAGEISSPEFTTTRSFRITAGPTPTPIPGATSTPIPTPTSTPTPTPTGVPVETWYKLKNASFYKVGSVDNALPATTTAYDSDDSGARNFILPEDGSVVSQSSINTGTAAVSSKGWKTTNYSRSSIFNILSFSDYLSSRNKPVTISSFGEINQAGQIYVIEGNQTIDSSNADSLINNAPLILIVKGDVTFDSDFNSLNNSVIVIATGAIKIKSTVAFLNGIFIGDSVNFSYDTDPAQSNTPLKIRGNLISQNATDPQLRKRDDTTAKPSVFIVFDPKAYFDLLPQFSTLKYEWKQLQ